MSQSQDKKSVQQSGQNQPILSDPQPQVPAAQPSIRKDEQSFFENKTESERSEQVQNRPAHDIDKYVEIVTANLGPCTCANIDENDEEFKSKQEQAAFDFATTRQKSRQSSQRAVSAFDDLVDQEFKTADTHANFAEKVLLAEAVDRCIHMALNAMQKGVVDDDALQEFTTGVNQIADFKVVKGFAHYIPIYDRLKDLPAPGWRQGMEAMCYELMQYKFNPERSKHEDSELSEADKNLLLHFASLQTSRVQSNLAVSGNDEIKMIEASQEVLSTIESKEVMGKDGYFLQFIWPTTGDQKVLCFIRMRPAYKGIFPYPQGFALSNFCTLKKGQRVGQFKPHVVSLLKKLFESNLMTKALKKQGSGGEDYQHLTFDHILSVISEMMSYFLTTQDYNCRHFKPKVIVGISDAKPHPYTPKLQLTSSRGMTSSVDVEEDLVDYDTFQNVMGRATPLSLRVTLFDHCYIGCKQKDVFGVFTEKLRTESDDLVARPDLHDDRLEQLPFCPTDQPCLDVMTHDLQAMSYAAALNYLKKADCIASIVEGGHFNNAFVLRLIAKYAEEALEPVLMNLFAQAFSQCTIKGMMWHLGDVGYYGKFTNSFNEKKYKLDLDQECDQEVPNPSQGQRLLDSLENIKKGLTPDGSRQNQSGREIRIIEGFLMWMCLSKWDQQPLTQAEAATFGTQDQKDEVGIFFHMLRVCYLFREFQQTYRNLSMRLIVEPTFEIQQVDQKCKVCQLNLYPKGNDGKNLCQCDFYTPEGSPSTNDGSTYPRIGSTWSYYLYGKVAPLNTTRSNSKKSCQNQWAKVQSELKRQGRFDSNRDTMNTAVFVTNSFGCCTSHYQSGEKDDRKEESYISSLIIDENQKANSKGTTLSNEQLAEFEHVENHKSSFASYKEWKKLEFSKVWSVVSKESLEKINTMQKVKKAANRGDSQFQHAYTKLKSVGFYILVRRPVNKPTCNMMSEIAEMSLWNSAEAQHLASKSLTAFVNFKKYFKWFSEVRTTSALQRRTVNYKPVITKAVVSTTNKFAIQPFVTEDDILDGSFDLQQAGLNSITTHKKSPGKDDVQIIDVNPQSLLRVTQILHIQFSGQLEKFLSSGTRTDTHKDYTFLLYAQQNNLSQFKNDPLSQILFSAIQNTICKKGFPQDLASGFIRQVIKSANNHNAIPKAVADSLNKFQVFNQCGREEEQNDLGLIPFSLCMHTEIWSAIFPELPGFKDIVYLPTSQYDFEKMTSKLLSVTVLILFYLNVKNNNKLSVDEILDIALNPTALINAARFIGYAALPVCVSDSQNHLNTDLTLDALLQHANTQPEMLENWLYLSFTKTILNKRARLQSDISGLKAYIDDFIRNQRGTPVNPGPFISNLRTEHLQHFYLCGEGEFSEVDLSNRACLLRCNPKHNGVLLRGSALHGQAKLINDNKQKMFKCLACLQDKPQAACDAFDIDNRGLQQKIRKAKKRDDEAVDIVQRVFDCGEVSVQDEMEKYAKLAQQPQATKERDLSDMAIYINNVQNPLTFNDIKRSILSCNFLDNNTKNQFRNLAPSLQVPQEVLRWFQPIEKGGKGFKKFTDLYAKNLPKNTKVENIKLVLQHFRLLTQHQFSKTKRPQIEVVQVKSEHPDQHQNNRPQLGTMIKKEVFDEQELSSQSHMDQDSQNADKGIVSGSEERKTDQDGHVQKTKRNAEKAEDTNFDEAESGEEEDVDMDEQQESSLSEKAWVYITHQRKELMDSLPKPEEINLRELQVRAKALFGDLKSHWGDKTVDVLRFTPYTEERYDEAAFLIDQFTESETLYAVLNMIIQITNFHRQISQLDPQKLSVAQVVQGLFYIYYEENLTLSPELKAWLDGYHIYKFAVARKIISPPTKRMPYRMPSVLEFCLQPNYTDVQSIVDFLRSPPPQFAPLNETHSAMSRIVWTLFRLAFGVTFDPLAMRPTLPSVKEQRNKQQKRQARRDYHVTLSESLERAWLAFLQSTKNYHLDHDVIKYESLCEDPLNNDPKHNGGGKLLANNLPMLPHPEGVESHPVRPNFCKDGTSVQAWIRNFEFALNVNNADQSGLKGSQKMVDCVELYLRELVTQDHSFVQTSFPPCLRPILYLYAKQSVRESLGLVLPPNVELLCAHVYEDTASGTNLSLSYADLILRQFYPQPAQKPLPSQIGDAQQELNDTKEPPRLRGPGVPKKTTTEFPYTKVQTDQEKETNLVTKMPTPQLNKNAKKHGKARKSPQKQQQPTLMQKFKKTTQKQPKSFDEKKQFKL